MKEIRMLLALITATLAAPISLRPAAAMAPRYMIAPGSTYAFLPSPFVGVPGGMPSEFRLEFGISGTFGIEPTSGPPMTPESFRFVDLALTLTGNEPIQDMPPDFALVTSERVAAWLQMRHMYTAPSVPMFAGYRDQTYATFMAQDWSSQLVLLGGFDSTPVDGIGVEFDVTAIPVPEPAGVLAAAAGYAALVAAGRALARA